MTIDEAITHAREVAEKERKSKCNTYDINDCYNCEKYKEISTSKRMTEIICPCGNKTFEYIPSENKNVRVDKNDCLQCAEEHEQIAEWLEELKARREAMEWIVTKDKRPTENQIVLTCDLKGWISTDIYNSGSMHRWNSGFYVAWMPLPKPYKE